MATTIVDFYRTDDSDNIINYNVVIGYGQEASGTVKLNENIIKSTKNSFNINLGTNKEVKGKTLKCYQTIQDIRPETNLTSMLNEITGGKDELSETLSEEAKENGSIVNYYCEIYFI
jgi:hypothetical protein